MSIKLTINAHLFVVFFLFFFQQSTNYAPVLRRHGGYKPFSCYFLLSFTYLLIVSFGSFTLRRLLDFISVHFLVIGALYFSVKNSIGANFFFKLIYQTNMYYNNETM